jgi:SAM-dependent methyltransferase
MVPDNAIRVLDVGCGGGDNARHLKRMHPGREVVGLTHSADEASIAAPSLDAVHVVDLNGELSDRSMAEWGRPFDLLLFSHVLEHLTDPLFTLERCLMRLVPGGYVLIAVPNVLEWRTRFGFLAGRFDYADHGILDRTHMRFFTFETAPMELIAPIGGLQLLDQRGRGAFPLGPLRKFKAASRLCAAIDNAGSAWRPNFCCSETVMFARWQG